MGADVHAFGVNNLKWTDDSWKIGYCPKELKKRRRRKSTTRSSYFPLKREKKKLRIKASAIEIPFTKALSESFGSVWIGQNLAKYALSIDEKKQKERMSGMKGRLCTNKQHTEMQHRNRWRMANMYILACLDASRRWLLQKQKHHQTQQQQQRRRRRQPQQPNQRTYRE